MSDLIIVHGDPIQNTKKYSKALHQELEAVVMNVGWDIIGKQLFSEYLAQKELSQQLDPVVGQLMFNIEKCITLVWNGNEWIVIDGT